MSGPLKGVVYLVLLVAGAFSGLLLFTPSLVLLAVHSKTVIAYRRKWVELISGIYFDYCAAVLMVLMNVKVHLYADNNTFLTDRGPLVLCNHRTRVDWMFAGWCYAALVGMNPDLRVVLKEQLRSVPIFGWAMQIMMYIFLSRKRDQDIPLIRRMLMYLLGCGCAPAIFLFPEGTDLSESNKAKSNAFAREHGLPPLDYVLYPKPSGLLQCLEVLRAHHAPSPSTTTTTTAPSPANSAPCAAVHDLTVAYRDHTDGVRTSDVGVLHGRFPREVHILVERHALDALPADKRAVEQWLRDSFYRKEALLKAFYEGGSSGGSSSTNANGNGHGHGHGHGDSNGDGRQGGAAPYSTAKWPPRVVTRFYAWRPLLIVGTWIAVVSSWLYLYPWFRWVAVCVVASCMAARFGDGFDGMELALHGSMIIQEALLSQPVPPSPQGVRATAGGGDDDASAPRQ